jgi:hypothetical protein
MNLEEESQLNLWLHSKCSSYQKRKRWTWLVPQVLEATAGSLSDPKQDQDEDEEEEEETKALLQRTITALQVTQTYDVHRLPNLCPCGQSSLFHPPSLTSKTDETLV